MRDAHWTISITTPSTYYKHAYALADENESIWCSNGIVRASARLETIQIDMENNFHPYEAVKKYTADGWRQYRTSAAK